MKVSYRDLNNQEFFHALDRIDKCPGLPIHSAISVGKLRQACMDEAKSAQAMFQKLIEKHADTETVAEGDKIITRQKRGSTGELVFRNQEEFQAEMESFLDYTFEASEPSLTVDVLSDVGLTPAEVRAIKSILEDAPCQKSSPAIRSVKK